MINKDAQSIAKIADLKQRIEVLSKELAAEESKIDHEAEWEVKKNVVISLADAHWGEGGHTWNRLVFGDTYEKNLIEKTFNDLKAAFYKSISS